MDARRTRVEGFGHLLTGYFVLNLLLSHFAFGIQEKVVEIFTYDNFKDRSSVLTNEIGVMCRTNIESTPPESPIRKGFRRSFFA